MTKFNDLWSGLHADATQARQMTITGQFDDEANRIQDLTFIGPGMRVDCSKNLLPLKTFNGLLDLAISRNAKAAVKAMFNGEVINLSEERAVLHTLLRTPSSSGALQEKSAEIRQALTQIEKLVSQIFQAHPHHRVTDVVNIGIGGSHLGPALVCDALRDYNPTGVRTHFVSNVDGAALQATLGRIDPHSTLFIIASKSFTTSETLLNAESAKNWFLQQAGRDASIHDHFVAVTAATEKAIAFGIKAQNVFPMWDWVGGRYSLWSAIGLPIALQCGFENFTKLLAGAKSMDEHFLSADYAENLPAVLALIGIWQTNFLKLTSRAVIPYDDRLRLLPAYLQQLEMESNGKHITISNEEVTYDTSPIVWGGVGTDAQHAFLQLLHQGTIDVPVDFIICRRTAHNYSGHHEALIANCIAQAEALMLGTDGGGRAVRKMCGNHSSNMFILDELTPFNLGALLALYEHRTMFQGLLWDINSFDQFGVELGKTLANTIRHELEHQTIGDHDPSTAALIAYFSKR